MSGGERRGLFGGSGGMLRHGGIHLLVVQGHHNITLLVGIVSMKWFLTRASFVELAVLMISVLVFVVLRFISHVEI